MECSQPRPTAYPGYLSRRGRLRQAASPLRALLAQRGAGLESRTTAAAETEDAHAVGGHFAMNRGMERDQGNHRGLLAQYAASSAPGEHSGVELTEELHRSLGSSRAVSLLAGTARPA